MPGVKCGPFEEFLLEMYYDSLGIFLGRAGWTLLRALRGTIQLR